MLAVKSIIKKSFNNKSSSVYDYTLKFGEFESYNMKNLRKNISKDYIREMASLIVNKYEDINIFNAYKNYGEGITIEIK